VLCDDAATVVLTTEQAPASARRWLRDRQVAVHIVEPGPGGIDVVHALRLLRQLGVESLLVEGGAKVITSLLGAGVVDRVVTAVAPTILGAGTEAVGDLRVNEVTGGIRLENRFMCSVDDDVLVAFDVVSAADADGEEPLDYSRAVSS
jgi:riboflavin biosynthesis pyrimidine reductase